MKRNFTVGVQNADPPLECIRIVFSAKRNEKGGQEFWVWNYAKGKLSHYQQKNYYLVNG